MFSLIFAAAAAATPTAVDAERAFSRDARRNGQWTASRAYADPDAVMFTPQAVWARDFLRGRKDPPAALSWSPNASYVSCDGRMAVNTGPWQSVGGEQHGFFTTVWQHEKGRWHWISDGRHTLGKPLAAREDSDGAQGFMPRPRAGSAADGATICKEGVRRRCSRRFRAWIFQRSDARLGLAGWTEGGPAIPHLPLDRPVVHPRAQSNDWRLVRASRQF